MPRTIDGFLPRAQPLQYLSPKPRPVVRAEPHRAHVMPRTPVRPAKRPLMPAPAVKTPTPAPAPPLPRRMYSKPVAPHTSRRGIPERLQLPLIIAGAMLAGIFAQSAVFGELLVAGYGIAALIWRVASRTTFTLALLSMVATTLLLVIRGNITLSQNFATYTFLLLVVGVITLIRELKKEGGRVYSRKNVN